MTRYFLAFAATMMLFVSIGCTPAPPVAEPPTESEMKQQEEAMEDMSSKMMKMGSTEAAPESGLVVPKGEDEGFDPANAGGTGNATPPAEGTEGATPPSE